MKYPIGIQTFAKIIDTGCVYIDKTKSIEKLMNSGGQIYFLSRPRRFGKSLLLSTLSSLFQGKKDLFKGLYIEDKIEWKSYPVAHLSLNTVGILDDLEQGLHTIMEMAADKYEVKLMRTSVGDKLKELIEKLAKIGPVVLLIDEYDKPLISQIEHPEMLEKHRVILKSFYGVIKDLDDYLKFVFITGVSRFARVSLFSDLNNLTDISMHEDFCDICGYSESDMHHYFTEPIAKIAAGMNISTPELFEKVRKKYNGYNFYGKERMYNPWSVLNFLYSRQLDNFWFESGTPTFLTQIVANFQTSIEGIVAEKSDLGKLSFDSNNLVPLLYQTGYLTIDEEIEAGLFTLRFPNEEVSESFTHYLLTEYAHLQQGSVRYVAIKVRNALKAKDKDLLVSALNPIFASIPYQIFNKDKEVYYHSVMHLVFMLLHYNIASEVSTNVGRIDTILLEQNEIWIFEFKLDSSAEEAFAQIIQKDYAGQYRNAGKVIYGVGVNFDSATKKIDEAKMEVL